VSSTSSTLDSENSSSGNSPLKSEAIVSFLRFGQHLRTRGISAEDFMTMRRLSRLVRRLKVGSRKGTSIEE
jgi:hypothetical protein